MNSNLISVSTNRAPLSQTFTLHYQLQFDLKSRLPFAAEALLRYKCDETINQAPSDFLNRSIREGTISRVTELAIDQALRDYPELSRKCGIRYISINISPTEISRQELVESVRTLLDKHQAKGESLAFEVTEKLPMVHLRNAVLNITSLRKLGIHIFLDDFGTGYTSLPALIDLPVSGIKLDRSFSQNISRPKYRAICESLLSLCASLKISITAEGIENRHLAETFSALGFTHGQGFHLHRPQNKSALPEYSLREPSSHHSLLNRLFARE